MDFAKAGKADRQYRAIAVRNRFDFGARGRRQHGRGVLLRDHQHDQRHGAVGRGQVAGKRLDFKEAVETGGGRQFLCRFGAEPRLDTAAGTGQGEQRDRCRQAIDQLQVGHEVLERGIGFGRAEIRRLDDQNLIGGKRVEGALHARKRVIDRRIGLEDVGDRTIELEPGGKRGERGKRDGDTRNDHGTDMACDARTDPVHRETFHEIARAR